MTSLVHIGDTHYVPGPRAADRLKALDQIITESLALPQLGAWLYPGDLFDAGVAALDCNPLDERIQRMADRAPVVICYGNHDRKGDLDGFARLHARFPIYVFDQPGCVRIRLATGENATVFVLPYPHKAGLVSAGVATGDVVDTAGDLLEPIFMAAAEELAQARAAGDITLMIGHVNVAGAIASTGQPNIGREIELNPKHLDRLGDIPKLLNHIHKRQDIAGAHYAGSICRMDYGEIEEKAWTEVIVANASDVGLGWLSERRRHPLHVPPMFHIDGVLTRDGFLPDHDDLICPNCVGWGDGERDPVEGALPCSTCHGSGRRDWTGAEVRVRYRYKASERSVLDPALVRAPFAAAYRLKVEGVAEPDRELRAPRVATAITLADKLAAYRQVDTLEASVAAKLEALEHGTPEQLLADVDRAIAALDAEEETVAA